MDIIGFEPRQLLREATNDPASVTPIQETERCTMSMSIGKTVSSVGLLAVWLILAGTARSANPPADPRPDPGSAASANNENAQLRSELEQLKQLVQQQQARITALEYRDSDPGVDGAGVGSLTDLRSPYLGAEIDGVAPPQAPKVAVLDPPSQTPQNAGSSDERIRNLERRLKGIGPLSFSGDVRVREEPIFGGPFGWLTGSRPGTHPVPVQHIRRPGQSVPGRDLACQWRGQRPHLDQPDDGWLLHAEGVCDRSGLCELRPQLVQATHADGRQVSLSLVQHGVDLGQGPESGRRSSDARLQPGEHSGAETDW